MKSLISPSIEILTNKVTFYNITNKLCLFIRSEMMSNKRINEGDNDSSSDDDNDDNNTTQQREDVVQQNSIDGTIEESQA